jgi:sarcosine oxidase subunit alpha
VISAGSSEPNALVELREGARKEANTRATMIELYDGLVAKSQNRWPSLEFDIGALNSLASAMFVAGFYYKTFMWPKSFWRSYEERIRRAAGLGESPRQEDPDFYDRIHSHCDVLVVGGGPAGLAAALAAGRSGARVILADEQHECGGSLLASRERIDGAPAGQWVQTVLDELRTLPEVRLLSRSTVFGYYDHNYLAVAERLADHLTPGSYEGPRQRLWRVRARQVVLAAGAFERPLVFSNNDRPGVMLAGAVSSYLNRYAVAPGTHAVVFTNNDGAYRTALDLVAAGVRVEAVVDPRTDPSGALPTLVRDAGIQVITGQVVVDVQGSRRLEGARLMSLDESGKAVTGELRGIPCDLLAVSGGWSPAVHLHSQSGGRARFDEDKACFVPGTSVQAERSAGACNGSFGLGDCIAEGFQAGAAAAREAGIDKARAPDRPTVDDVEEQALKPLWLVPSPKPPQRMPKQFVDLQNDTSAADILLAAREGYRSIEHVKRYTALGFGTDQGKLGNINGMAILAQALGQDIPTTGTTTFRPAYTPVSFGTLAGHDLGELLDPVRTTAIHAWHHTAGAKFENVGQWKRPWYYPKAGESIHDAVNRECLAVRRSVGMMDASTLGKIDVRGRDAAEFLNRVYSNAWLKLGVGNCRYGFMLGEDGMVMDDGVTTRLAPDHFHMTTTTGGAAGVMAWLERWLQTEWPEMQVYLTSVTDHWATMAVVGPQSRTVVSSQCSDIDFSAAAFPFMSFREGTLAGVPARVFRISFSGELAYEVNVRADYGLHVWEALMEAGRPHGITPYGTETMHVLRAEKGYIIAGQDTDGSVTPVDLGMDWIIAKNKPDFIGKRSLTRPDTVRTDRKQLVGLKTLEPGIVLPEGAQLVDDPDVAVPVPMIGHVSSSYYSACLSRSIALALVKGGHGRKGESIFAPLDDGRIVQAEICDPVFYDPEGARQNV